MTYLYIIDETYTNGYSSEILDIISLFAILSGVLVIVSKNPVVSVLFLIGLFASISCYLIMIGLSFLGLSYLIVYIGAVSILFLFILMLINIRISELQSNTSNSIPLAVAISVFFSYPLFQLLPYNITILNNYTNISNYLLFNNIFSSYRVPSLALARPWTSDYGYGYEKENTMLTEIYYVTSKSWDGNLIENSHITSIGNIMYTNYSIWLIITSYILLLAMVGAIVITIKHKTNREIGLIGRAIVLHTKG
jgi:NADH-ubiquinone oxidoreductase chain 6